MDSTILQHPYVSLSFAFNSYFLYNKKDPKNRPTKRSALMPSNPILLEVKKNIFAKKKSKPDANLPSVASFLRGCDPSGTSTIWLSG